MKIPAYFTGFGSRSDGSAGLRFNTQEISAEQYAEFKKLQNAFGWLVFEEGENIPSVPKEKIKDGRKSQATRIRNHIFRIHQKNGGREEDSEAYYIKRTEEYINELKEELN